MKLDKIRFAMLINWLSRNGLHELATGDIEDLDSLIDIEGTFGTSPDRLNDLLSLMQEGTSKIEAIKAYRDLTGCGLKESKDAVEKYWPTYRQPTLNSEDVLYKALKNGEANAKMQRDVADWLC